MAVVVIDVEKQWVAENAAVPPKSPLRVVAVDADVEPEERKSNVGAVVLVLRVETLKQVVHLVLVPSFQVVPPSHPPPQQVCCPAAFNQHKNMRSIIVITLLVITFKFKGWKPKKNLYKR
jgi:hypothetical protein